MTQPPPGEPPADETRVFRPGEYGGAPPPQQQWQPYGAAPQYAPGQPPPYGPGQPPYGPGQPPYGAGQPPPYAPDQPSSERRRQGFNAAAAVLVVVGAALIVVADTVLRWFRDTHGSAFGGGAKETTFAKLHDELDALDKLVSSNPAASHIVHFGVSVQYFDWLGWVLLAAAVVLGLLAIAPIGPSAVGVRVLAVLAGLAGIGLTLWALDLVRTDASVGNNLAHSYGWYLSHTSWGAWAALLGFLLVTLGAVMGPRRG